MVRRIVSRRRKTPQKPHAPESRKPVDIEAQRRELFAIVSVAACLAHVIDDEYVPAADLIGRIADRIADALSRVTP
jgi:hypothetical protein